MVGTGGVHPARAGDHPEDHTATFNVENCLVETILTEAEEYDAHNYSNHTTTTSATIRYVPTVFRIQLVSARSRILPCNISDPELETPNNFYSSRFFSSVSKFFFKTKICTERMSRFSFHCTDMSY